MQEEVENRTVNLAISTTKLTARALLSGFRKFNESRQRHSYSKAVNKNAKKSETTKGKQTIKQLLGQNQGVTSIDISQTDLRGFEKYARMYGIDYAITKDASGDTPKYLCFFKSRDADAMTAAFNAYSSEVLKRGKTPSVLQELEKLKTLVISLPQKVKVKMKERNKDR